MADKMMRIAARGADGLAKPISVNRGGLLRTQDITLVRGKNLFNKAAAKKNQVINHATGASIATNDWYASDYTYIEPGINPMLMFSVVANSTFGTSFYDIDYLYVSGLSNNDLIAAGGKVTIPDNAAYLRTSFYKTQIDALQIEYGETKTDYEAFTPNIHTKKLNDIAESLLDRTFLLSEAQTTIPVDGTLKVIPINRGKNLFNRNAIILNRIISPSTGVDSYSVAPWCATEYILLDRSIGGSIVISAYLSPTGVPQSAAVGSAFYDSDMKFISGVSNDDLIAAGTTLAIPVNATYFRLTTASSYLLSMQIEYGTTPTPYEAFVENKTNKLLQMLVDEPDERLYRRDNLFIRSLAVNNTLLSLTTGLELVSSGWFATHYVKIDRSKGTSITFDKFTSSSAAGLIFYTADKQFVSSMSNEAIIAAGNVVTYPAAAMFFRFSSAGNISNSLLSIKFSGLEGEMSDDISVTALEGDWLSKAKNAPVPIVSTFDDRNVGAYKAISSREKYAIYSAADLVAIHKSVAVKRSGISLLISTDGIAGDYKYAVEWTAENFPGISSGSFNLINAQIIPFTRNLTTSQDGSQWRLVLLMSTGQIYHNFPSRSTTSDGTEVEGDIVRFEESVVWDLPERKYPSLSPSASGVETFFPGLSPERYDYHPILNTDPSFVDTYGNGGYGKSITKNGVDYPRFFPTKPVAGISTYNFYFMGGNEYTDKVTLVGHYSPNNGASGTRICLFATSDGGRSWYTKYEFASGNGSYGEPINLSSIVGNYASDSFVIHKRSLVTPSAETPEPTSLFSLGAAVPVTSISKASPSVVVTDSAHGLQTGDVIAFKDNSLSSEVSPDYDWMRNDTLNESSGGNGKLFVVVVVNSTSFQLYEHVHSAYNNIGARHIHFINQLKDGFLMGTGEIYPQGWLFYIPLKAKDSFEVYEAWKSLNVIRLTSTSTSVQRMLGAVLVDDDNHTLIYASDESGVSREAITLPNRTISLTRNSTGIFAGRIEDVDDNTKFHCIFEAFDPAYFFKKLGEALIFVGQRGEFGVSFDDGKTWQRNQLPKMSQFYRGSADNVHLLDNILIVIK